MTRRRGIRGWRAAWLGTAALGFGCSQGADGPVASGVSSASSGADPPTRQQPTKALFPRDLGSSDWVRAAWRPPERPSAWAVPIIGAGAAAQDPANTTEIALASSSGKTSGLQPAPRAASPDKEIVASSPETTRQRASDPDLVALYLEANRASLPHLTAADFATDGIPASSDASTPVRTATAEDAKARPQLLAVSEPIPSDGSKRVERKAEPDPAPVTAAGPPKVAEPEEPAESKRASCPSTVTACCRNRCARGSVWSVQPTQHGSAFDCGAGRGRRSDRSRRRPRRGSRDDARSSVRCRPQCRSGDPRKAAANGDGFACGSASPDADTGARQR